MSTIAVSLTLILALLLGSVGGATALATDSLPGSPAYPIKLLLEQVSLVLTTDPTRQAEQHLLLAQERSQEIRRLAIAAQTPPQDSLNRLQLHLNLATQHAERLGEPARQTQLLQIREVARQQERVLMQLEGEVAEPVRAAVRAAHRLWVHAGEQAGNPPKAPAPSPSPAPSMQPPLEPPQNRVQGEGAPAGKQNQYGQPETPAPAEPANQEQAPAGEQNQYGQPETPAPAEPGNQEQAPAGEQNQYGQPETPAPAEPGNQEQAPAGEQNQYGQPEAAGQNPENGPGEQEPGGQPDQGGQNGEGAGQNQGGGRGP